jgi:hypothetical protein
VENLAWALVVAARARILMHKLLMLLKTSGVTIYLINADEVIVNKNTLNNTWTKQNIADYKKKPISQDRLCNLKTLQFELIYKRSQDEVKKNQRIPWHKATH